MIKTKKESKIKKSKKRISLKTLYELSKSLCKIILIKSEFERELRGTGFFLKIQGDLPFYFLITSYHIISEALVDLEKSTYIEIITEFGIEKEIELNNEERLIKIIKELDIVAIQIVEKDTIIDEIKFLNYDENEDEKYINKDVFILQYPKCKELEFSNGKINKKINGYEFLHSLNTYKGSSASPIFLFDNKRVMGVHTKYCKDENNNNIGVFIGNIKREIFSLFKKEISIICDSNSKYIIKGDLNVENINLDKGKSLIISDNSCLSIGNFSRILDFK